MKTNLSILTLMISVGLFTGCAKDNANVAMKFGGYTVAERGPAGAKLQPTTYLAERPVLWKTLEGLFDLIAPPARAAVSEIRMCFKRLRFKQDGDATSADSSQDADNIDLELGLVTLDSSGTGLGSVSLPAATYGRVEFDLEDGCGTGYSIYVDNAGIYSAADRITIKFEGTFEAEGGDSTLSMSVQSIIDGLSGVTADNELKDAAELVSGSF